VVVRVPDRDLGEAPDPAVTGGQVGGGQTRDQRGDVGAAAAQVTGRLGPGYRALPSGRARR